MILEMQLNESSWKPTSFEGDVDVPVAHKDTTLSGSDDQATENESDSYFIAKVRLLIYELLKSTHLYMVVTSSLGLCF